MPWRRRLCTLSLAIIAGACRSAAAPATARVWSTVALAPASFVAGDTVRIVIDVVNQSAVAVRIFEPGCNLAIELQGADGTDYLPAEHVLCPLLAVAPISLPAGESARFEAFTTGRVVRRDAQEPAALLAPGSYLVRSRVSLLTSAGAPAPVSGSPATLVVRTLAP